MLKLYQFVSSSQATIFGQTLRWYTQRGCAHYLRLVDIDLLQIFGDIEIFVYENIKPLFVCGQIG